MFAGANSAFAIATAWVVLSMPLLATGAAQSQTAAPSLGLQERPQPTPAPANEPTSLLPQQENPGLINEIGKLFERSKSMLPPLTNPAETIDDLNARAKTALTEAVKNAARNAGKAMSRLAKPSPVVSGRMICPVAANGTPDCKAGADRLCQSRGFRAGTSLDSDAAETCSAKVLIPGRQRKPGDCRTDDYVTSALCR